MLVTFEKKEQGENFDWEVLDKQSEGRTAKPAPGLSCFPLLLPELYDLGTDIDTAVGFESRLEQAIQCLLVGLVQATITFLRVMTATVF